MKGCMALVGLVLVGAGVLTAAVGAGASAGILRSDPAGLVLTAAFVALLGAAVFVVATGLRRDRLRR